jgi:hypothetical protein
MPIYQFKHPETGEIFEDLRSFKDIDKPYVAEDGVKCERVQVPQTLRCWRNDREVFEADPDYAKKIKPKYVRFRDGHRERYDPTKHC